MTAIQIQDRVSAPLRRMTNVMNIIINSFEQMENSSRNAIDRASLQAARNELRGVETDFADIEEQIRRAREQQDRLTDSVKEGTNATDVLRNLFRGVGGILETAGVELGIGEIFNNVNDQQQALNSYQAQTGVNNGSMSSIEQSMKNLYMDNMGESFDDIANSMATVTQITGQMGSQLERTTSNALLMRDTFQFDVTESIRAADMMQKQFGLNSQQAFNLIAQGAQNGLNKNGDLLDSINEYSVHFKSLGMNAEQMFNVILNGAKSGTFSVDKLGDSIKEFGIKAIDGSKTSAEGFKMLGLNSDAMVQQFSAGGDIAREAFDKVTQALERVQDPAKQNAASVALFGTMAEDLGVNGVLSMRNMEGSISTAKNALEQINNQRYDDAGSALASLGRTVNVQLTDAVGGAVNNVKIAILDFTRGLQGDISNIQGVFGYLGYSLLQIGNIIQSVASFFTDNWSIIAPIILGIAGAILVYTAATKGAALTTFIAEKATSAWNAVQSIFNTIMGLNPIFIIIGGIILLIAIVFAAVAAFNKFTNSTYTGLGVICGAVAWAVAVIINIAIGLINAIIQSLWSMFIEPFIGIIEWVLNVANGGFDSFGDAVANLIGNVISWFLSLGKVVTKIIDAIFGTDWTAGLSSLQNSVVAWGKNDNAITLDRNAPTIDSRIKYDDAWKAGNKFGDGLQNKVTGLFKKDKNNQKNKDVYDNQQYKDPANSNAANSAQNMNNTNVPTDVKGIKDNTKKSADAVEMTHEDLKYIRDIAERDIVNRFTTAEIKVEMGGVINNVGGNNPDDIDKLMDKMTVKLTETMSAVAERSF